MLRPADNLGLALDSIRAHKLRASLTILGLTMGVATLITVMTLVQGANLYVEQKIANLGTNVFRIGRLPFAVIDFAARGQGPAQQAISIRKTWRRWPPAAPTASPWAQRFRAAPRCATATSNWKTPPCTDTPPAWPISTPARWTLGRYFTDVEDRHAANVCLIGDRVVEEFFAGRRSASGESFARRIPSSSSSARSRRSAPCWGRTRTISSSSRCART